MSLRVVRAASPTLVDRRGTNALDIPADRINISAMLELEAAVERILALIPPAQPEAVELDRAHGRILAARVVSTVALPAFDNSAMDGYAVRAVDVQKAGLASPVSLKLTGRVAAGEIYSGEVAGGGCVRVFTGSPLPRGADAVVMQEDTRVDTEDAVSFLEFAHPWENVRFRGEDFKPGDVLGEPGCVLTAGRISLLAAAGITQIQAGRQPVVALLASGSELLESGQPSAPGKIHESNRAGLAALVARAGAVPRVFPLVRDTPAETRAALESAFHECDLVITTGGVSVGEMDFIKSAFEEMGGHLDFWKVALRPGRPFVFGQYGGKFLFGLPGNPVSAFVTFLLLARPALRRWQGASSVSLPTHPGVLAEPLANSGDRRNFLRVRVGAGGEIHSSGPQGSHLLVSLATASGLVDVPPKTSLPTGTTVSVMHWE